MSVYRGIIEAPKFAGFSSAIKNFSFYYDVDVKLDIDRGFWFETVRFEVSGDDEKIRQFTARVSAAIQEYNNL